MAFYLLYITIKTEGFSYNLGYVAWVVKNLKEKLAYHFIKQNCITVEKLYHQARTGAFGFLKPLFCGYACMCMHTSEAINT